VRSRRGGVLRRFHLFVRQLSYRCHLPEPAISFKQSEKDERNGLAGDSILETMIYTGLAMSDDTDQFLRTGAAS